MLSRTTSPVAGVDDGVSRRYRTAGILRATAISAVAAATTHATRVPRTGIAAAVASAGPTNACSRSIRTSPADCRRVLTSFCRQRRSSFGIDGGRFAGNRAQSGSRCSTRDRISGTSSPSNARRPASISKSTHPNAQISARLSTVLPRACSGDMYAAVPRIIPACVACSDSVGDIDALAAAAPTGSIAFARPKSRTFTVPSARTLMLAGFRSRWMMPCSCAASSASAICFAMGNASSSRNRATRDALREIVALDQFHHESACIPPPPRGRVWRRYSDGSARRASSASRSNRARRSGSDANASGRILIATSRPSFVSARDTLPPSHRRRSMR